MKLFRRANRRHLRRQPLQAVLSASGIALGVAVVLAVDLANHSALRAFRIADQAVSGDATHSIVSAAAGIDETFYRELRVEHGFRDSAPRVTGAAQTPAGRTLEVLGIDPLAAAAASPGGGSLEARIDPGALITGGTVVLTDRTARDLGVSPGEDLEVVAAGRRHRLQVAGIIEDGGVLAAGLSNVLVVDISTAQVLLGRTGTLSRIDVRVEGGEAARIRQLLPPDLELRRADSRSHAMDQMTRAFQINLTALSLLALVIGAFLIYNAQTLFVLNRREVFAVWRTLGITRPQVMTLVLSEALWLAAAGCLLGCAAGVALAGVLLDLVTRSINDLYFSVEVRELAIDPFSVAKACLLGLGASLLATAAPAMEAARVRPRLALARSEVESTARWMGRVGIWVAAVLWLLAAVVLTWSERSIIAGFTGLFFIVMGFAFAVPAGLRVIGRLATLVLGRSLGWLGLWSARSVVASASRTQIAVAALAVALAATIGVSVMIQSFRLTVEHWLDSYLRADVYISRAGDGDDGIDPRVLDRVRTTPGVAAVSTGRWRRLPTAGEPTRLFVLDVDTRGFRNFQLANLQTEQAWPAFSSRDGVIVSEPYAYHRRLEPGNRLELPTGEGPRSFAVIDVFYDYASDRGTVVMHRDTYDRYWDDPVFESIAAYLEPGVDGESFIDRLATTALRDTGLAARSNTSIQRASLEVFDRTFTVTEVLRLLTIIVACIGIIGALAAYQLERSRELAVLRASGLTRGELSRMMMVEGGLMGTAGAILSIPLGIVLAAVLVFVINKRSFGWSMQFTVSWEQAAVALLLGLVAGTAAAIYPAWRMNRRLLITSLRYE